MLQPGTTKPVAFMSRKFTSGLFNGWDARDKEAYAVVSALDKWESWIGTNPLTVLPDHQALRHWVTEVLTCESGLSGRRARWHQKLDMFSLTVVWIRGVEDGVVGALSRFA